MSRIVYYRERDDNLNSWFQCSKKSSLVPRMLVETIGSALGLVPMSSVLMQHFHFLDGLRDTLADRLLLELGRLDSWK